MTSPMRITALLPMKAHSERVPNKNLRPLNGRPLYHHILNVLLAVDAIDRIVINTDSDVISRDAPLFSPKIVIEPRPANLCGDHVSMNFIIAHDIKRYPADLYLQTHSTNPCLTAATIAGAITALSSSPTHDSLFTVNAHQSRFYWSDGSAINHDPGNLVRTQDLPVIFEENSCLYLFTAGSLERRGRRIGERPLLYQTSWAESIDIDTEAGFRLAEVVHGRLGYLLE